MIRITSLPKEVPLADIQKLYTQYKATGKKSFRDQVFEGLMRKVYVWCWPYTHKYVYGDDALMFAYEVLNDCLQKTADIPYLRVRCVGACVTYMRQNQPSVKRSGQHTEISTDDIMKLDIRGTGIPHEYDVDELVREMRLTELEADIILLTVGGLTTTEIGLKLGYSRRHIIRVLGTLKELIARKYNYRRPGWTLPPSDA